MSREAVILDLHRFLDESDYMTINGEIEAAQDLFMMTQSASAKQMSLEQVKPAIAFAMQYVRPDALGGLASKIGEAALRDIDSLSYGVSSSIGKLLLKAVAVTEDSTLAASAWKMFLRDLDYLMLDCDPPQIEKGNRLIQSIAQSEPGRAEDFSKYMTGPERLDHLTDKLAQHPTAGRASACLFMVLHNLRSPGKARVDAAKNSKFFPFVEKCFDLLVESSKHLNFLLTSFNEDPIFFAVLMNHAAIVAGSRPGAFANLAAGMVTAREGINKGHRTKWFLDVHKSLVQKGHGEFACADFVSTLYDSRNPVNHFWGYHSKVVKEAVKVSPEFKREFFTGAVSAYLKVLPKEEIYPECEKLIKHAGVIDDEAALTKVIQHFENTLQRDWSNPDNQRSRIEYISGLKDTYKITTTPDITGLFQLGIGLDRKTGRFFSVAAMLQARRPGLEGLEPDEYGAYLDWLLGLAAPLIREPQEHVDLLRALWLKGKEDRLVKSHIKHIEKILKPNEDGLFRLRGLVHALLQWKTTPNNPSEGRLNTVLEQAIVQLLHKQNKNMLAALDEAVQVFPFDKHSEVRAKWDKLFSGVLKASSPRTTERTTRVVSELAGKAAGKFMSVFGKKESTDDSA
jgi:hypothetical protein